LGSKKVRGTESNHLGEEEEEEEEEERKRVNRADGDE